MKKCFSCRLIHPDESEVCECGYEFVSGEEAPRMGAVRKRVDSPPHIALLHSLNVIIGLAMVFAIGNLLFNLFVIVTEHSLVVDLASPILLIGTLIARTVIKNMKRLHWPVTAEQLWEDAKDSTFRAIEVERAFRYACEYLPTSVLLVVIYKFATGDFAGAAKSVIVGIPVLLGIPLLGWRRKWRMLRTQQVQSARDALAAMVVSAIQSSLEGGVNPFQRFAAPRFIYLRPFSVTGCFSFGEADVEMLLSDAVAPLGPLVALGRAGEARGAGRASATEEEWRSVIAVAVKRAERILVLPGTDPGIRWEIGLLKELGLLEFAIFVVPPLQGKLESAWHDEAAKAMESIGLEFPDPDELGRGILFTLKDDGSLAKSATFEPKADVFQVRSAFNEVGLLGSQWPQDSLASAQDTSPLFPTFMSHGEFFETSRGLVDQMAARPGARTSSGVGSQRPADPAGDGQS